MEEPNMDINIEEELKQVSGEMDEAENSLIDLGFPENQWLLIRTYINASILQNHLTMLKTWQDLQPPTA